MIRQPALAVLLPICAFPLWAQRSPETIGEAQLRLWLDMKKFLTASDGADYFRRQLLNSDIPSGVRGLRWLKGTVVSSEVVGSTRNIVLAMSDKDTPEVTLKIDRLPPADIRIRKGAVVEFDGVGMAFAPSPFMLTFEVEACRQAGNEDLLRCGPETRLQRYGPVK
jgi:hypothetical protein